MDSFATVKKGLSAIISPARSTVFAYMEYVVITSKKTRR